MFTTMAVRIDSLNYPIAIACLPAVFADIPQKDVIGKMYLVINELLRSSDSSTNGRKVYTTHNSWYEEEQFVEFFEPVPAGAIYNTFYEVRQLVDRH